MIPEKLVLEGFLSYKTRVEVDLSQVKVACVSGANGAGKSTLFDAITWTLFGKARRSDDALINNKADRCQVAFAFLYENNRYRVERTKPRGKGTALEFHVQTASGSWKPLTEAGVRLTEERIREVLRLDYDTFINASFFLQGKADMFAIQPPARRKEILSSILGLEVWESYRDEASKRRRDAQSEQKTQQIYLEDINNELDQENERVQDLSQKKALLASKAELRENSQQLLDQAHRQESQLQGDLEKLSLLKEQALGQENQLDENKRRLGERQQELLENEKILADEKSIHAVHEKYLELREALRALDGLSTEYNALRIKKTELMGDIDSEKARLEQEHVSLQKEAEEIDVIQDSTPRLLKELAEKEAELAALIAEVENITGLEEKAKIARDHQSEKEAENNQLSREMQTLKKRMEQLEIAIGTTCPLCAQPLTGSHREHVLADLKSDGTKMGDAYRANSALIEQYKKDHEELAAEIKRLRVLQTRQPQMAAEAAVLQQKTEEYARRIEDWKTNGVKRFTELHTRLKAGTPSQDKQTELASLERQIASLGYAPEEHKNLREQEISMQAIEEKFRKLDSARTAQAGLSREIADLSKQIEGIQPGLETLKKAITDLSATVEARRGNVPNVSEMEEKIRSLQREENALRADVGAAQQLVSVLDAQRKRKIDIEAEIQTISRQIARLKMLETAFGRDGIPALLIEQAIPQIEAQANDILDKLTNGNMSVNFETERDYADKKREDKKQTLDIMISDSAGRRAYELFSGGEAFRINFAIRLALSRMLAHRSGARLQTLVIDEGFGSQDAEGRQRLVEAINLVSDDFEKMLVITHLDELKDAFSSRIEVTKTSDGSQVEILL